MVKYKDMAKILNNYDVDDIDIEIWKDINHPDLMFQYQISNYARIRNKTTGRMIKPYFTYDDNGNKSRSRVALHSKNSSTPLKFTRYRLVAYAFLENDDPIHKTEVDHLNGDRTDDHFSNLEWVTPEENKRRETVNHQRNHVLGEKNSYSKFKDSEVDFICKQIYVNNITNYHILYELYLKEFGSDRCSLQQVKTLYYNITHPSKPKWTQISIKYKK